jgi:oligopeptide/dipeptide ABC transporter ATP-binding protein
MGASGNGRELLSVRQLKTYFPIGGRWTGKRGWVRAVDGVDLNIERGEVVALVGESGSGKSTFGRSVLALVPPTSGTVHFDGVDVLALRGKELRGLRRRMQIIFQDPYSALSPRMQIKSIVAEPLRLHRLVEKHAVEETVARLLDEVGLESYFMYRYPHEMSGGQRQRVAIARALSLQPDLLVADEPVSALDVSVQAQILSILVELHKKRHIAMLFISHDLSVVEQMADRTAVMYLGKIVEQAPTSRLLSVPQHPYTQALISAVPEPDPDSKRERIKLRGEPPSPTEEISGCPFASRCPEVQSRCRREAPQLELKAEQHRVACLLR